MSELTLEHFRGLFPHCPLSTASQQVPLLNDTMRQYRINNKRRIAAFCATLAVESGEFRYRRELASGAAYEGRRDLGNTVRGDGVAMKGHGRIQITGRANHTAYARYIKESGHVPYIDFSNQKLAKQIADDPYALDSAGWFWSVLHDLNSLVDRGDFLATQVKVNGRNKRTKLPNHWKERDDYYKTALRILPDDIGFDDDQMEVEPAIEAEAVTATPQATAAAVTPAAAVESANVPETDLLNQAMASDGAKQAWKKILAKAAGRLVRPIALLYGALEAGNVFAWLGVIVLFVGLCVLIYLERADLKRAAQWLGTNLKRLLATKLKK